MTSDPDSEPLGADAAAVQHALLQRLLEDEAAGRMLDVAGYQAAFPGYADLVGRTLAQLGERESTTCDGHERVGPYVLIRELGRGGQGTVYLARDSRLGRMVALKVLNAHRERLSRVRIERFRREAEAASRIEHPCICGVLESGEYEGLFYIAMRYVAGESLAIYIARAAADDTRTRALQLPSSTASESGLRGGGRARPQVVLALVERTARALHVAHEAGIVHRDVKPGNIMVTPEGEPVLLDFGLARDLEETSPQLTRSEDIFGTPAYMAPEQLRRTAGGVDRRADIYALGVTLFECLTLRRPYGNAGIVELADALERTELPDPRELEPALAKDLSVIVACAMARLPAQRYATALDFADDIARVRAWEPIRARPAGPLLRMWRWTQRNRVVACSMLLVIASLATALGLSLAANARVASEHRKALDEVVHRQEVHDFLAWVLKSPSPLLIGPDTPLRTVFGRAMEEIGRRFGDRPRTRGELLALLGETQISIGDAAAAIGPLTEAIPLLRAAGADQRVLSTALVYLARARDEGPAVAAAAYPLLEEAHALAVSEFGPDSEEALLVLQERAACLALQDKEAEAVQLATQILTHAEGLSSLLRRRVHIMLGNLHSRHGRWNEALAAFTAAGAIEVDPADQRDAFERLDGLRRLCNTRARVGPPGDALETSSAVLADMRALLGERHEQVALSLGFHGTLLRRLGKHDEAAAPYEEALAILEEQDKGPRVVHAVMLNNLGALYRFQKRFEDALRLSEAAAAMIEALGGEAYVALPAICDNLADTHADRGEFPAALAAQEKSLALLRRMHGDEYFETVCAFHRTGRLYALCDRFEEAVEVGELGLEASRRLPAGNRPRALRFANDLALTLLSRSQAEAALRIAQDSLEQVQSSVPNDAAELARCASDCAVCLQATGDFDAAAAQLIAARDHLAALPQAPRDVAERLQQRIEHFQATTSRTLPPPSIK